MTKIAKVSPELLDSWNRFVVAHPEANRLPDKEPPKPVVPKAQRRKAKAKRPKPAKAPRQTKAKDPLLLDPWPVSPQDLPYPAYLLTPHWRRVRTEALRQAGHRCTNPRCGETQPLEVHHRHYRSLWRECANDVMVLCATCHALLHGQYIAV